MSLFSFLSGRPRARTTASRGGARLRVENLEDRTVPSGLDLPSFDYQGNVAGESVFSLDQFEQNIRDYFVDNSVGFAYAINQNGVTVRHDGEGDARTDSDDPQADFTEDTRMTIASVAKTITATAILKILQDQGISVDAAITPYLPAAWNPGDNIDTITFRELLTHHSGLRRIDHNGDGGISLGEQTSYDGLRQIIEAGIADDDLGDLKADYSYENANFALMRVMTAYLLGSGGEADAADDPAQYTADCYVDYVSTNVLAPMGILNADTAPGDDPTLNYDYPSTSDGFNYGDRTLLSGGEGWWLSADELAKFLHGVRTNNGVLSSTTRQMMFDDFLGWNNPEDWAWSAGMFGTYYNHGGDLGNLNTAIMDFPNTVQVALLVNSDWGPDVPHGNDYQAVLLKRAFENAWPEITITGTANDDSFEVRRNSNDYNAIDIFLNGDLVVTRWVESLDTLRLNGVGGDDTFTVAALPAGIELEINGNVGYDTVILGDAQFDFAIAGDITVDGGDGEDTLRFNDADNFGGDTYTVTDSTIDKSVYAGIVTYADFEDVEIHAGQDGDTINILESDYGTEVHVYGGTGDDTIVVGNLNLSSQIGDSIHVHGEEDDDHLVLSDQNGAGPLDWYVFQADYFTQGGYGGLVWHDTVESVTLESTSHDSIVNVQGVQPGVQLTINGRDGEDTVRVHATAGGSEVVFNGGDHNDTLELAPDSGDLDAIDGSVTFNGGGGSDELLVNDANDASAGTYTLGAITFDRTGFGLLTFSGAEQVELQANDTGNLVAVNGVANNTHLSVHGNGGDDDIIVAGGAGDLDSAIFGDLSVYGGANDDTLLLTDDGDLFGNDSYTFGGNTFTKTGLDAWSFPQTEHVILVANPQANVITVGGLAPVDLTINAGGGDDIIHIGTGRADLVLGDVHVNGDDGLDTIHINDENAIGAWDYAFTDNTFDMNSLFFGSLDWSSAAYVVLHAGDHDDTITATSSPADTSLSLFGNGGTDTFQIAEGDLDALGGSIAINGGAGADVATVRDEDDAGDDNYAITATTVSKAGFLLTYFDVTSLTLRANDDTNTIDVHDTLAGTAVNVELGHGNDTVHLAPLTQNLSFIAGPIDVDGGPGSDTVYLHDENYGLGADYTVTNDAVSRAGFGGLTHDFVEHIHLHMGAGNDTANVTDFSAAATFYLYGSAGDDTFNVYARPQSGGTGGRVVIDGGTQRTTGDRLNVFYLPGPVLKHTRSSTAPGSGSASLAYPDAWFWIDYRGMETARLTQL